MSESGRHVILYVHGMGGGGDSRIPSILKDNLGPDFEVVIRTYDFDPDIAHTQLSGWAEEVHPDLVIGESMGAAHAIALRGYPHLFVSPSLNAPRYFFSLAWLTVIPGMTALFDRIYRPKDGDRQRLHFTRRPLLKWKATLEDALRNTPKNGSNDYFHAFFGTRDHYRRSGVVSIRTWRKYFGDGSWTVYDGTHFMENEYVLSLLIPKIREVLGAFGNS